MSWKIRYATESYESYGPEHPNPDILEHIRKNVQSFYDAGGRIEIHDPNHISKETADDYSNEADRYYKDLEDFKKQLGKYPDPKRNINSEIDSGSGNIASALIALKHEKNHSIHPNSQGSISQTRIIIARNHEGRPSGAMNVSWIEHDPEEIKKLNDANEELYQKRLKNYYDRIESLKQMRSGNDPWAVSDFNEHSFNNPVKPQRSKPIPENPGGTTPFGSASIGTIKRVPGTGSALQHAYTTILAPKNIGVSSSYASEARTFHKNVGRRVDWEESGKDGNPTGSSIWLPSDVKKIASIQIHNPNIKRFAKTPIPPCPYGKDDHNLDEFHPAWEII